MWNLHVDVSTGTQSVMSETAWLMVGISCFMGVMAAALLTGCIITLVQYQLEEDDEQ